MHWCIGVPPSASRGMTLGGPVSPHIFNIMVDAIIWEWLRQTLGEDVAKEGYWKIIGELLAAFYADDGLIQSCYSVIGKVRVRVINNQSNDKAIIYLLGEIRVPLC